LQPTPPSVHQSYITPFFSQEKASHTKEAVGKFRNVNFIKAIYSIIILFYGRYLRGFAALWGTEPHPPKNERSFLVPPFPYRKGGKWGERQVI